MPALLEMTPMDVHPSYNNPVDTTDDDDGLEGSGIDPVQELNGRLEHSRITGEYYRSVSANYAEFREEFERTGAWPEHPFPNERHIFGETLEF